MLAPENRPIAMEMTDLQGTEEHIPPSGDAKTNKGRVERKSSRTINPLADRATRRLLYLSILSIYCLFIMAADIIFIIRKAEINTVKDAKLAWNKPMQKLALIPARLIWELLGSTITMLSCLAVIFMYETDLVVMGRDLFAEEFYHFLAGSLFIGSVVFWASGEDSTIDPTSKFIVTKTTTRVVYTSFQILLLCGELLSPLFNNENIRFLVRAMLNFYVAFDEFLGILYLLIERQEIFFLVSVSIIWASLLAGLMARLAHISVRRLIKFPVISILMGIGACCYVIAMCINADEIKIAGGDVNLQTALRFYLVTWGLFYFTNLIVPAIDNAMYEPRPTGGFQMLGDYDLELDDDLPEELSEYSRSDRFSDVYKESSRRNGADEYDEESGLRPAGATLEDVDLDDSLEDKVPVL